MKREKSKSEIFFEENIDKLKITNPQHFTKANAVLVNNFFKKNKGKYLLIKDIAKKTKVKGTGLYDSVNLLLKLGVLKKRPSKISGPFGNKLLEYTFVNDSAFIKLQEDKRNKVMQEQKEYFKRIKQTCEDLAKNEQTVNVSNLVRANVVGVNSANFNIFKQFIELKGKELNKQNDECIRS